MGFPDNYTDLPKARKTNRYQATGNSWAVPVVKWLGKRIIDSKLPTLNLDPVELYKQGLAEKINDSTYLMLFGKDIVTINNDLKINGTSTPENCTFGSMKDIVSPDAPEDIYISPVGCFGIVRRKRERNLKINSRLEKVLLSISSNMSPEEIEKRSRVQKRGKFSDVSNDDDSSNNDSSDDEDASNSNVQVSIFDLATNE